jgi:hypothetical protein
MPYHADKVGASMITFISAVIFATSLQAPPQSLLRKVVPNPTGNNGYELFLAAGDLTYGPNNATYQYYLNWGPNRYEELLESMKPRPRSDDDEGGEGAKYPPELIALAKRLDSMTQLQVRREMAGKYRPAIDLIRKGLRMRIWDPRQKHSLTTLYPELATFKSLAKLMDGSARVAFADGHPNEGAQILFDSIEFGRAFRGVNLIHSLVSIAIGSIAMANLEQHMECIPLSAAIKLEELGLAMVPSDRDIETILRNEAESHFAAVAEVIDSPESLGITEDMLDENEKRLWRDVRNIKGDRRARFLALAREKAFGEVADAIRKLRSPESTWTEEPPELPETKDRPGKNSAEDFVMGVFLSLGNQEPLMYLAPYAKARCQARLLSLHGSVIRYKWEHGKLPDSLGQAVSKDRTLDPLSQQEFVYERQGFHGFRIYSRGSKETGEMGLKYRRQGSTDPADLEPPPPNLE